MVRFRRLRGWALVKARLPRVLLLLVLAAGAIWLGGFLVWIQGLLETPDEPIRQTDGIVAFTGGAHRIELAVSLLAEERAERLLISGVNQRIKDETLRDVVGISPDLFDCCIDLGRVAQDTRENAIEAAAWARRNGYRTLRIVTTYDHMPRSLLELKRAIPEVEAVAHPVSPRTWTGMERASLTSLALEYSKYWVALIRFRFTPPPPITAAPDLSEIE